MKKVLLSVSLLSVLLLGACSTQDKPTDSTSSTMTSQQGSLTNEEDTMNTSDYLIIDTKSIKDSEGKKYEVPEKVKSLAGIYSGVNTICHIRNLQFSTNVQNSNIFLFIFDIM